MFITSHSEGWVCKREYIHRELGMPINTIKKSYDELDAAGYLDYEVREFESGIVHRKNIKMRLAPKHWGDMAPAEPIVVAPTEPAKKMALTEPSMALTEPRLALLEPSMALTEPRNRLPQSHYEEVHGEVPTDRSPQRGLHSEVAAAPRHRPKLDIEMTEEELEQSAIEYEQMLKTDPRFKITYNPLNPDAAVPSSRVKGLITAASRAGAGGEK